MKKSFLIFTVFALVLDVKRKKSTHSGLTFPRDIPLKYSFHINIFNVSPFFKKENII